MADQDQKLCDKCHERPAMSNIVYGKSGREGRSLCQVCLLQDVEVGGLTQRINETIRTGQCKYCGAPAETGWGGHALPNGELNLNLVCQACYDDLVEFTRRPENATSDFTPGPEGVQRKIAELADFRKRQDEFIRQRVLKRKSKG